MKIRKIAVVLMGIVLGAAGCSDGGDSVRQNKGSGTGQHSEEETYEESIKIAECFREIYERSAGDGMPLALENIQEIVECLGNSGYAAVDNENQVDMVNADKVKRFVQKAENKKKAEETVICVLDDGGFIRYDFETDNGDVQITRSSLSWDGTKAVAGNREEYPAVSWVYSGYGCLFFEQYRPSGFDGPSGHKAIRVEPLDERCRELNRQYIQPVGYGSSNLFITDWDEQNYKELDFYDLYEILYRMKFGSSSPYGFDFEVKSFEIPDEEFETVFETYFSIDRETLRRGTVYHADSRTYQYRPRDRYDLAHSYNIPYPEVVSYENREDGTIRLTVNAVWPEKNLDCALCHEVVVRPIENGGFEYVSNRVISYVDKEGPTWYRRRLTQAEWEEYYGGTE